MPVTCDILIMLLKGPAEKVATFSIGDEIEVVGGRRVKRRAESGFPWIGNRARRQTPISICVVWRRKMQVAAVELPRVGSGKSERIRYRGIALQRLAPAQAVFKHAGHMRPLFGTRRLAFHEGGERHDILNALARRSACGRQCLPLLPEFLDHGGRHVFSTHMARKFVRRGKKEPLKTGRVDSDVADRRRVTGSSQEFVARKESLVRGKIRDIKHRESLGNRQFLDVHPPIRERIVYRESADGMVEEILARLQGRLIAFAAQNFKCNTAAHDAVLGEESRDGALRSAARDVDEYAFFRESLVRSVKREIEIAACQDQQNQKEQKEKGSTTHIRLAIQSAGATGPDSPGG
jgi:hypothetical protein